jgi:hypothetical protein
MQEPLCLHLLPATKRIKFGANVYVFTFFNKKNKHEVQHQKMYRRWILITRMDVLYSLFEPGKYEQLMSFSNTTTPAG